jgi:hypothetical protein
MTTAIVGNAALKEGQAEAIEDFDRIIRFNNPPSSHVLPGMRTDLLYLANTSKQTAKLLTNALYVHGPVFGSAKEVCLPIHPEIARNYMPKPQLHLRLFGRRSDHTDLCKAVCSQFDKKLSVLSVSNYEDACLKLGINETSKKLFFPSTGFLAILQEISKKESEEPIHLFGFSFQGWKKHKWLEERAFVMNLVITHPPVLSIRL